MKRLSTLFVVAALFCASISIAQIVPVHQDPQEGTNPKSATLLQTAPITVDGDFSDWPTGLEDRSLGEFFSSYSQNSRATSTQDNWFQLAWNDTENRIYFAGWVHDDVNCTQMSNWGSPGDSAWFRDLWWMYLEWDNMDREGTTAALANLDGQHQYAISLNDPGSPGLSDDPLNAQGSEVGSDGEFVENGTTFYSGLARNMPPHGQAPLMDARMVVTPDDPAEPFGPFVLRLEMSFGVLNYLDDLYAIEPDDIVDLDPNVNDGRGIGWDITYVDRDGILETMESPGSGGDPGGAWIGWSDSEPGGKNPNPFFNGTLFFSMEFAESSAVSSWDLY